MSYAPSGCQESEAPKLLSNIWLWLLTTAAAFLLSCIAAFPAHADSILVPNRDGADDDDIQQAINDLSPATADNPGFVLLRASGNCSNQYTLAGTVTLKDHITIRSEEAPTTRACIARHAAPPNSPAFDFFTNIDFSDDPNNPTKPVVNDVRLGSLNIDGRGPGAVADKDAFVDMGLHIAPPPTQNDANMADTVTVRNVRFEHMYGVCTFTRYTINITYDNVDCVDPTKGGLIQSFGSRHGTIIDSSATGTNDDALALTSANATSTDSEEAWTGDFTIENTTTGQEIHNSTSGGSFLCRGCRDVVATDNTINRKWNPEGTAAGSLFMRVTDDANSSFHVRNVRVREGTITAYQDNHDAVNLNDSGMVDVFINNNVINYSLPKCGIRLAGNTPANQLTASSNTFSPDGPNNIC